MGRAAHVLPPGHPPARASSGSSSGAYRLGRTSCASSLGRVPHEDEEEEEEEEEEDDEDEDEDEDKDVDVDEDGDKVLSRVAHGGTPSI